MVGIEYFPNDSTAYCDSCGMPWDTPSRNCDHGEEEAATHYHVVAFVNGCLNDYDSGPIEDIESARDELQDYLDRACIDDERKAGDDRYEIPMGSHGSFYILNIEECTETCDLDADY